MNIPNLRSAPPANVASKKIGEPLTVIFSAPDYIFAWAFPAEKSPFEKNNNVFDKRAGQISEWATSHYIFDYYPQLQHNNTKNQL